MDTTNHEARSAGTSRGRRIRFAVAGVLALLLSFLVGCQPVAVPGDGAAVVSWQPADGHGYTIVGYQVTPYVAGAAQPVRAFDNPATTQTITGLANGTTYTFRVTPISDCSGPCSIGSPSEPSDPVTVGTPTAPRSPSAQPGDARATLTWAAPAQENASPVQGYVVTPYVGTTAEPARTLPSAVTPQDITGLTNGTTYTFRVAAMNAMGTGPTATTAAITVGAPVAPGSPTAQAGDARATVSWNAPADNGSPITAYVVTPYIGGAAEAPRTFAPSSTSRSITGLTNGTTYTFRVAATNARGTGPSSTTAPVTVGLPGAPGTPTARPGNGAATVTWAAPAGAIPIAGYILTPRIGTVAQPPQTFTSNATTQTITGLPNGSTFTFTVAAFNSLGTGPQSAASNPVVVGAPNAPAFLTARPGPASSEATLTWWAPDGNASSVTGYAITPYIGASGQATQTFMSTANTLTVTGLTAHTTYTFRVAAINVYGTGAVATSPPVTVGRSVTAITSGGGNSCAVLDDTTVECWGANGYGQLGNGTQEGQHSHPVPVPVSGLSGVTAITGGHDFECALLSDGTVRCWGRGLSGEMGNGSATNQYTPVAVQGLTGVTAISAASGSHACALVSGGVVKCWGSNTAGQLGDGSTTNRSTPVTVPGLTGVTSIVAGYRHSCAVLGSSAVMCWGANDHGQLGDGTTTPSPLPVAVQGLSGATHVAAGAGHSCALLIGGTAKCWGENWLGQLGGGASGTAVPPVAVQNLSGATAISAGWFYTCALRSDGSEACWGANQQGQLGDGSTSMQTSPVTVLGLTGITDITASSYGFDLDGHSCALRNDGTAWCWGWNGWGQLGDGGTGSSSTPVRVRSL